MSAVGGLAGGGVDPSLVKGRRVLIRAIQALGAHGNALILVGAHAVQEWAADNDADLGGSPASLDADVQVDAAALAPNPTLEQSMQSAGFSRLSQPGAWLSKEGTQVDLLVAEDQARGDGTRSATLDPRDPKSARRARGLESCLVLNEPRVIGSLGPDRGETVSIRVARPAALIVAKAFKITDRLTTEARRARGKDALDVLRLLLLAEPELSVTDFQTLLNHARFGGVADEGLHHLKDLFAAPAAPGSRLLQATYGERGELFAAQVSTLATDWLKRLDRV